MTDHSAQQPYVGPRPFAVQDHYSFFGRDAEINDAVALIIAYRLLLLYAPSGAGKTSLLNAGVIPALQAEGFEVLRARVGTCPYGGNDAGNIFMFNALTSISANEPTQDSQLEKVTLAQFLSRKATKSETQEVMPLRILIFDQLEELFTCFTERWLERQGFFQQISEALELNPNLRVVLTMREDYIAFLDPYASILPDNLHIRFRLMGLDRRGALRAVTGPAELIGRRFASGVAERLVEDLLTIHIRTLDGEIRKALSEHVDLVQLQLACSALWNQLRADQTVVTMQDVELLGSVENALSNFYERSIREASSKTRIKEGFLRRWFENSLITPAGTSGLVYRGATHTGDLPNQAVDYFEELHLIKAQLRNGAIWFELANDRLINAIQGSNSKWLRKLSVAEQKRLALEDQATEWLRLGRSGAWLNSGELLDAAWLTDSKVDSTDAAEALIASIRRAAGLNDHRRTLILILFVTTVVATLAAIVGWLR